MNGWEVLRAKTNVHCHNFYGIRLESEVMHRLQDKANLYVCQNIDSLAAVPEGKGKCGGSTHADSLWLPHHNGLWSLVLKSETKEMVLQPLAFLFLWHTLRATDSAPPFPGVSSWFGEAWREEFRVSGQPVMQSPWSQHISIQTPQTAAMATGSHAAPIETPHPGSSRPHNGAEVFPRLCWVSSNISYLFYCASIFKMPAGTHSAAYLTLMACRCILGPEPREDG